MTFALADPQPGPRADSLDTEALGPGLYPSEVALALSGGALVAAGLETAWLPNNGGVSFTAWARWIEADGSSRTTAQGERAEIEFRYTADAATIAAMGGVEAIGRELLLAVLGEDGGTRAAPADGGGAIEVPVLDLGEGVRRTIRIRAAIAAIESTGPQQAAGLLGL
jgi:hypothetical protein